MCPSLSVARAAARLRAQQAGVTLIELMVAIAVAAVLLGLAVPSFTAVVNGNRITAAANELSAGLQSMRMEAIRRNARGVLCRSDDGLTCNAAAGAWGGWISFIDTNNDNAPDNGGGAANLLRTFTATRNVTIVPSPAISGNGQRLVVRADGMIRDQATRALLDATLRTCMPTTLPPQNLRDVALDAGSRVSIQPGNGGGACAAPAN